MKEMPTRAPNPALKDLEILVGKWKMELSNAPFLGDPSAKVESEVSFEWLEDRAFLIIRMSTGAIWLIHRDAASSNYQVFYYDDRQVSRIYEMSFSEDSWKLWRHSSGFSQRFEGRLSPDRNTISAAWEKSMDNRIWEHDFDVTYQRLE